MVELCVGAPFILLDLGGVKTTACGDDVALIGCGLRGLGGNETAYVETDFSSLVLLCEGDISRFSFFEGVDLCVTESLFTAVELNVGAIGRGGVPLFDSGNC